ncbi:MAG: UDP-N-acetylmuramoyl-tripeptide--D-alanyl-D-alanine ligase [Clostridiales bacterium]|jgi:UDP-N-acetylmuramoyl-tripeptide--D-alanyl-D-alanine ligase|nr:UDP-N-acetylmuramoyl-tripeptide--D-alanyl-D-alanine ligase [Clostridiales bacterium]
MIDYTIWAVEGIEIFLTVVMLLVTIAFLSVLSYKIVLMLQLSGYRGREFGTWYRKSGYTILYRYGFLSFLICLCTLMYLSAFGDIFGFRYLGFGFFVVLSTIFIQFVNKIDKNPLKYTPRAIRLYITSTVLFVLVVFGVSFVPTGILGYFHLGLLPLTIMPIVLLANIINTPGEKGIQQSYIRQAKAKLASMPNLKIVAITGSYGKTTSKNILHSLLSTKYLVCSTPASYNTPMGVCLTINNQLQPQHEYLILEMGARYQGDILELIDIANPNIAMITSVGNQHLDTMHNYATVLATKLEIASQLTSDGVLILDGTNTDLREVAKYTSQAILVNGDSDRFRSSNVIINNDGTQFDLVIDGMILHIATKLLGRHIAGLVAMCIATAYTLGVTDMEAILATVADLQPVPHRLQLLRNTEDYVIIDNAYSSNIVGAVNALEVLSNYTNLSKIIVTPGIVEQGDNTQIINTQLGVEIAKVCDYSILIGKNSRYLQQGIASVNSNINVIVVDTLAQAVDKVKHINLPKVVLFENDLPDNM